MERLTEYEVVGGHVHAVPTGDADQAMMRLAAYEDSGLTPSDVHSLWGEWDAMMSVLNSVGSYDRLRVMAAADRDGRVVILPCKIGDTVWYVSRDDIDAFHIEGFAKNFFGESAVSSSTAFPFQLFGKCVFTTREEAEAKLKEVQKDD